MDKEFHYKSNPPLGAHTSISGGLKNAIYSGQELGCDVVQIFSKNQRQWMAKALQEEEVKELQEAIDKTGVVPVVVHDSYLINIGSPKPDIYEKSFDALLDELIRCDQLNIPCLVMHPGSHLGEGEEKGLNRIAESLKEIYNQGNIKNTIVLLETTAGQGTNLGYTFEQLQYIIEKCGLENRVGVCVDSCHIFAAGYDIREKKVWEKTKKEFDQVIGLDKIKIFHLNDCKRELGSKIDRHERIGKGLICLKGFANILNDKDFRNIPMILEIPGGDEAYAEDLKILRKLIK